ncbi:hypothetical protein GCM10009633_19330 [Janibacter melonis]
MAGALAALLVTTEAARADAPNTWSVVNEFQGGNRHYETWSSLATNYPGGSLECAEFAVGARTKSGYTVPSGYLGNYARLFTGGGTLVKHGSWTYSSSATSSYQLWHAGWYDLPYTSFYSKGLARGWSTTSSDYALGYSERTPTLSHYTWCN